MRIYINLADWYPFENWGALLRNNVTRGPEQLWFAYI